MILHFNRGTSDPDGDGHYDCIPAVDNFQLISGDEGLSWGPVTNISSFLQVRGYSVKLYSVVISVFTQEHRGLLPGPGTGDYLPDVDRIIFAGHYSTAERSDGRVVMYFSDDGGGGL